MFGGIENVDLVFLTAVVGVAVRYGLWPSLLASVAASLCYNFFFLPPVYTFTITDPTNVAAFFFFMLIALPGFQCRGAGAHAGRYRDRPGAHHRIALCLQPQARGHRDARRRVVGDRLPDRADAEGAGGAAVAGGGRADRQGRLSAGGRTRPGRSRRRQLGLEQRPPGRARLGYAAGRQAAVPADADRARPDRRHRHRRRPDRAAADAGSAPPAGCAGRSGRARDRAGAAGRGHGPRQAHRGDRTGCAARC